MQASEAIQSARHRRHSATHPMPAAPRWFERWLRRRGPMNPPFTVGYRQIYILPTRFGLVFGSMLFAMLLGALNYNNNAALFLCFLLATAAQVSTFRSWRNLAGLHFRSINAEPVFAGQTLRLDIGIEERDGLERPALQILAPGSGSEVFEVEPWQSTRVSVELKTRRRGWMPLPGMRAATCYPIGLFRAWCYLRPPARALVYPAPARQAPPLPPAAAGEDRPLSRAEAETEFAGLREYRHGDSLKSVAWKASARNHRLISRDEPPGSVSEYLFTLQQAPAQDTERRLSIITSWLLQAERQRARYGLELPGLEIAPGGGRAHLHRCLRGLALWQP